MSNIHNVPRRISHSHSHSNSRVDPLPRHIYFPQIQGREVGYLAISGLYNRAPGRGLRKEVGLSAGCSSISQSFQIVGVRYICGYSPRGIRSSMLWSGTSMGRCVFFQILNALAVSSCSRCFELSPAIWPNSNFSES